MRILWLFINTFKSDVILKTFCQSTKMLWTFRRKITNLVSSDRPIKICWCRTEHRQSIVNTNRTELPINITELKFELNILLYFIIIINSIKIIVNSLILLWYLYFNYHKIEKINFRYCLVKNIFKFDFRPIKDAWWFKFFVY